MKKLNLSIIALALSLGATGAYAQASVKMLGEMAERTAKTPVNPQSLLKENDSIVVPPVLEKNSSGVIEIKKEAVLVNQSNSSNTGDNKEISPVLEANKDATSTADNIQPKGNSQVEPIKKSAKINTEDVELLNRLRKFFIVSDYMIETPYEYAGYLLFRNGIEDKICDLKKPDNFYMLDHEGGRVNRIKSPLIAADKLNPENEDDYYHQWNKDLTTIKQKCVNVILGPTVDVNYGDRSYSKDLKNNLQIALPIVSAIERKGMLPVIKHFPGEMLNCVDKFARKEVRSCPQGFEEINEEWKNFNPDNFPAIMMSNYIYEKASPLPAVMDEKMYKYLKNTLGYKGLIITDALWEMSVPITPKTVWEIFKNVDLILLIDPKQVENMLPFIAKQVKALPDGLGEKLLQEKEHRVKKAKKIIVE